MLNFSINMPPALAEEFGLGKDEVESILDLAVKDVAAQVAQAWRKEAARNLGSTRQQYVDSVIEVDSGKMSATIELVGSLANMIEEGAEPFDQKQALLSSPKAKTGENGKYITVPFSLGTPTALKENFSTVLPDPVYEAILGKVQDIPTAGGMRTSGLSEGEIPSPYDQKVTKKVQIPKSKKFSTYTHKHSIYEGAIRQKSNVTGQNSYVSFRRVSENSDPMSWIHPGLEPRKFAEKALDRVNVPFEVGRTIDRILSNF